MTGADLVADDEQFDCLGSVDPAAALRRLLDLGCEGAEFLHFLGEVIEGLERGVEGCNLLLGVAGTAELLNQAFVRVLGGFLKNDRLTFFCRNLEVAVGLELLLRGVEPLLESGRIKDRWDKCCRNFFRGSLAVMVGKDGSYEANGIG